ncbi:MAG: class I SAM-dependent rRNA methyltransferase [Planctomycetota bacterium]|nr:class I SAM-dependent rRNA methyltransferase [Planctomycetota bacterium]
MTTRKRQEKELQAWQKQQDARRTGRLPRVELRSARHGNHPWVYRRMLAGPYDEIAPGELVEAYSRDGAFVGRGFYNANSEIALRLLTQEFEDRVSEGWFRKAIERAVGLRHDVLKLNKDNDAYRVVHSEGDGLSGLVADRYADCLVLELFSAGMHRYLDWVTAALQKCFPKAEIVVRADHRNEKLEGVKMDGPPPSEKSRDLVITEGGKKFHVDLRRGHKTGFFVDQRENRARIAGLCGGEDVFDGFSYTGGFGVSAALGGAKAVQSVDLDENVVAIAKKNRDLNKISKDTMTCTHGNVFDVLREYRTAGRAFSRVILDPAKLAISRHEIPKALDAYADMNRLGMHCLQPGGVLLSCSCTGLVSEEEFISALRAAAAEARKELQIFQVSGAPGDHPWAVRMPEGRYLKAVYSRVYPL